ncbi:MAG: hypothetical protein RR744_00515 [Cellulosilyticaceae bacterium]
MNRTIDGSFKYLIIDKNNSIVGYIKNLPSLPHDENSLVRVFSDIESRESVLLKFSEINGTIIKFGMSHMIKDVISKSFFYC